MKQATFIVKDPLGIHARPAGLIVKASTAFESEIKLVANGKEVDAKRIMAVMGLGVKKGESVIVKVSGIDEAKALEEIEKIFLENL